MKNTKSLNATTRTRCLLIYENKNQLKFFIMKRVHQGFSQWMVPGGGVEHGENNKDALIREVVEETGVIVSSPNHLMTKTELLRFKSEWSDFENAYFHDKAPQVECIEQKSDWWYYHLQKLIDPEDMITEPDKFSDAKWVTFEEFNELAKTENINFDIPPSFIKLLLNRISKNDY